MNTSSRAELECTDWRSLYRAAILEANHHTLLEQILEAVKAVVGRRRELSNDHTTHEEMNDLEDALYTLRAFRTAWQHVQAPHATTLFAR